MNELLKDVHCLKSTSFKRVMCRLINIYIKETSFNEGSLEFNDLLIIYNLFRNLEEDKQC